MKLKFKNKNHIEIIILLVIIATISLVLLLGNYILKPNNTSHSSNIENYSVKKIHKYQVILSKIDNLNIPLQGYIDTRNSTYYIYLKSVDNIITDVTEEITLTYFDPNIYSYEEIKNINLEATRYYDFNKPPKEEIPIENIEEENEDTINEDEEFNIEEQPEQDEEFNIEEIPEQITEEPIIETPDLESKYPLNWLDIGTIPYEEFNINNLTNFCNTYNEIEGSYSLTCNKNKLTLKIKNTYNLNYINGYILKTNKYDISLPVKSGTKLKEYLKELKSKNIIVEQIEEK